MPNFNSNLLTIGNTSFLIPVLSICTKIIGTRIISSYEEFSNPSYKCKMDWWFLELYFLSNYSSVFRAALDLGLGFTLQAFSGPLTQTGKGASPHVLPASPSPPVWHSTYHAVLSLSSLLQIPCLTHCSIQCSPTPLQTIEGLDTVHWSQFIIIFWSIDTILVTRTMSS